MNPNLKYEKKNIFFVGCVCGGGGGGVGGIRGGDYTSAEISWQYLLSLFT